MKKILIIAVLILLVTVGCGYKTDTEESTLSDITQEDIAAIKPQDNMVYLFIWKMDDLPRYGYWGYVRVFGMAIYDSGMAVYYDFGTFNVLEDPDSLPRQKNIYEYIYDYIQNADWDDDLCIMDTVQIDPERLKEYIVRVNRADAANEETEKLVYPSDSDTTHEWEYYGVQQGEEPVFVFLRHELYDGATIIQNTDREAQEAFELMEPIRKDHIRVFDPFLKGQEYTK